MARERKIPLRKCSGCGEMKPKKELVRVVHTPNGEIELDTTSRLAGRGAYICNDIKCLLKAKKQNRFAKAFNTNVSDEVYVKLEEQFAKE